MTRELRFRSSALHAEFHEILFQGSSPEFHEHIYARAVLDIASVAATTNHGERAVLISLGANSWMKVSLNTSEIEPKVREVVHVEHFGSDANQTVLGDIRRIQETSVADIQRAVSDDSWILRERLTVLTGLFGVVGSGLARCCAPAAVVKRIILAIEDDALTVARGEISQAEALSRALRRLLRLHRGSVHYAA